MGVFNAKTKVPRAVPDPITDDRLPSPGALSWGAITTAMALAGTTGADTKLVNGNRWQQIAGDMTENYTGNVGTTVMVNETHTVLANRTKSIVGNQMETIVGNHTATMIGAHMETNIAPRTETRVAPIIETDCSPKAQTESTSIFKVGPLKFEAKAQKNGIYGLKMDVVGMAVSLNGIKIDAGGAAAKTYIVDISNKPTKVDIGTVWAKMKTATAKIVVTTALIGALRFGTAFKPNALPSPTPITPFD